MHNKYINETFLRVHKGHAHARKYNHFEKARKYWQSGGSSAHSLDRMFMPILWYCAQAMSHVGIGEG